MFCSYTVHDADAHPCIYTSSIKQHAQKCRGKCEITMNMHRQPLVALPVSKSEKQKMFLLKIPSQRVLKLLFIYSQQPYVRCNWMVEL